MSAATGASEARMRTSCRQSTSGSPSSMAIAGRRSRSGAIPFTFQEMMRTREEGLSAALVLITLYHVEHVLGLCVRCHVRHDVRSSRMCACRWCVPTGSDELSHRAEREDVLLTGGP